MGQQERVSNRPAPTPGVPSPDPGVRRWLARTLAADPPRAKSLIVTVWGDALGPHGGEAWLGDLIRLLAPFNVNERLVRTSVFRLARDGWLEGSSHGRVSRYRLTRDGARRFDDAHRRIYERPDDEWHGDWELVLCDGLAAAARAALRRELAWAGFGELAPNAFLRPRAARRALPSALLVPAIARHVVTMRATDLPGAAPIASVTARAWNLDALAADYRRFLQRFGAVIERFAEDGAHDPAQCFLVRTLLIHAYRRVLLRDPLLPAALLPLDWPGAAAYALCRDFYRRTHRCAERHLVATLTHGGALSRADPSFYARFGGLT